MIGKIHNSYIFFSENPCYIIEYYKYIVNLFIRFLSVHPELSLNINLCTSYPIDFKNNNKIYNVHINYEHNILKQNKDYNSFPNGKITDESGNPYMVRIDNYNILNSADIIIDYTMPNVCNIKESGVYDSIYDRLIYISPSIYNSYHYVKENRNIPCITTFINPNPRREHLIGKMKEVNIPHININTVYKKDELREILIKTKVLVNIHQTDIFKTFEELRVLPALQCGTIVISETPPLYTTIPFHDYIIWTTYENMNQKVLEVLENYDMYFDQIYNTPKAIKLEELHTINYKRIEDKLLSSNT